MATDDVDEWIPSMEDEMKLLREHKVWELVDLPKGRVPIKNWWRFVIKRDTDDLPIRYKSRIL